MLLARNTSKVTLPWAPAARASACAAMGRMDALQLAACARRPALLRPRERAHCYLRGTCGHTKVRYMSVFVAHVTLLDAEGAWSRVQDSIELNQRALCDH